MTVETPQPGRPSPQIQVRRIQGEDLPGIASLHRQVFPDYFLTHLGQGFLQRFYREFVDRPGNYGCVAIHDGRPIGVVVGTTDADTFYSQFYSRNLVATILDFLKRFSVRPLHTAKLHSQGGSRPPRTRLDCPPSPWLDACKCSIDPPAASAPAVDRR